MRSLVEKYAETAFVLGVTAAAMVYPPSALAVAAVYFVVLSWIEDRRTPAEPTA